MGERDGYNGGKMMADLESLLDDYAIPYITSGKNASADWVNINCTGVGDCDYDENFTMGIHRGMHTAHCWYCSQSYSAYRVATSLGIPYSVWKEVMEEQDDDWGYVSYEKSREEFIPEEEVGVGVPGGELAEEHTTYLESRGFDVEFLKKHYHIKGTLNYPDDYKKGYRIFFPITYKNVVISFVGRSYLPDARNKYMCCDKGLEILNHKFSLFNVDKAVGDRVIVVEGPLDCIKLVQGSNRFDIVATFGTSTKPEQLQLLRERYKEVIILYDPEGAAQAHAKEIVSYLHSYGVKAKSLNLKTVEDPGALDLETAKKLVNYLLDMEWRD